PVLSPPILHRAPPASPHTQKAQRIGISSEGEVNPRQPCHRENVIRPLSESGLEQRQRFFSRGFGYLSLSCQHAKGDAPGKLLDTRTIVVDHPLLDSLESIGETSFDEVEINPPTNDRCNVAVCVAACTSAAAEESE